MLENPCADLVGSRFIHHFGARRTGIDMAMGAGLVALAADVDLKRFKRATSELQSVRGNFCRWEERRAREGDDPKG